MSPERPVPGRGNVPGDGGILDEKRRVDCGALAMDTLVFAFDFVDRRLQQFLAFLSGLEADRRGWQFPAVDIAVSGSRLAS